MTAALTAHEHTQTTDQHNLTSLDDVLPLGLFSYTLWCLRSWTSQNSRPETREAALFLILAFIRKVQPSTHNPVS